MTRWWTGLTAAETTVECGGHRHTLRWDGGRLTAVDHGDPEAEATLAALAGESAACIDLLRAWSRRRGDPRVLALGSRGPTDTMEIDLDRPHRPRSSRDPSTDQLLDLLALGGGLPARLQADAIAIWTRRLSSGHRSLAATMPQLHAALHGRLLLALRLWLDEPALEIELEMVGPGDARTLRRDGDTIVVMMPFAWLSEVWAPGLTTIFGRLCLRAHTSDGRLWELETIGPDLQAPEPLTLSLG